MPVKAGDWLDVGDNRREWERLKSALDLGEGFRFHAVQVPDPATEDQFAALLSEGASADGSALVQFGLDDERAEPVVTALLRTLAGSPRPRWVLVRGTRAEADVPYPLGDTFLYMNQKRDVIAAAADGPVVLLMHPEEWKEFRERAPDSFSVHDRVYRLVAGPLRGLPRSLFPAPRLQDVIRKIRAVRRVALGTPVYRCSDTLDPNIGEDFDRAIDLLERGFFRESWKRFETAENDALGPGFIGEAAAGFVGQRCAEILGGWESAEPDWLTWFEGREVFEYPLVAGTAHLAVGHAARVAPHPPSATRAVVVVGQAIEAFESAGFAEGTVQAMRLMAALHLDRGDLRHALTAVRREIDPAAKLGPVREGRSRARLAALLDRAGKRAEARREWEQALFLLADAGSPLAKKVRTLYEAHQDASSQEPLTRPTP